MDPEGGEEGVGEGRGGSLAMVSYGSAGVCPSVPLGRSSGVSMTQRAAPP